MLVNIEAIKGEKGTGFEVRGSRGPFECGNCGYFRAGENSCGQKDMMEHSKFPKLPNGRIVVGAEDCCEYIDRIGKFWRNK